MIHGSIEYLNSRCLRSHIFASCLGKLGSADNGFSTWLNRRHLFTTCHFFSRSTSTRKRYAKDLYTRRPAPSKRYTCRNTEDSIHLRGLQASCATKQPSTPKQFTTTLYLFRPIKTRSDCISSLAARAQSTTRTANTLRLLPRNISGRPSSAIALLSRPQKATTGISTTTSKDTPGSCSVRSETPG